MTLLSKILVAPSLVMLLSSSLYSQVSYSIKTDSLSEAIMKISKISKLPFAVDKNILKGKKANSIKNIEGLEKALKELLKGTGLKAVISNNTIVIVKIKESSSSSTLEDVEVIESSDLGSSKNGYLIKKSSDIGIWKGKNLQDTPYSINVMSEEYIENLQATSTDEVYNINPVMQVNRINSINTNAYVFLRGFSSPTAAFDGMRREKRQYTYSTNIEEYQRLETLTGLSGLLYGASPVGGIRNFVPKRPRSSAEYSLTLGNAGGKGPYLHADLSSPLDEEGKFAYRLNVLVQDGGTHVENQNLKKNVLNFALDYQISDNFLLQGLVADSYYRLDGRQTSWYLDSGASRPDASTVNSNKLWGPEWAYNEQKSRRYSANLTWHITDKVNLRAAFMKEKLTTVGNGGWSTVQNDGTYTQVLENIQDETELNGKGGYVFLDAGFDTGNISHDMTIGIQSSYSY